ncbi:MAG: uracil-DNA glycosylase family protein [Tabrizicola sp.]|nr:uracil-DNA glycosylase family protein [Tabrizicola sp.]
MGLLDDIRSCRLCSAPFAATATAHEPRPVVWFRPCAERGPRLLVAGQAPGARVHESGRPFTDRSGDRLRAWMGVTEAEFYDLDRVAVVPMAFCFPGYDAKGSDLPPPPLCASTWRSQVMAVLGEVPLTLLVGGAAIRWHLGLRDVTQAVADWRGPAARGVFPLPHPSWRNTGWLKRNPWFEADLLPDLRQRVRKVMDV